MAVENVIAVDVVMEDIVMIDFKMLPEEKKTFNVQGQYITTLSCEHAYYLLSMCLYTYYTTPPHQL